MWNDSKREVNDIKGYVLHETLQFEQWHEYKMLQVKDYKRKENTFNSPILPTKEKESSSLEKGEECAFQPFSVHSINFQLFLFFRSRNLKMGRSSKKKLMFGLLDGEVEEDGEYTMEELEAANANIVLGKVDKWMNQPVKGLNL